MNESETGQDRIVHRKFSFVNLFHIFVAFILLYWATKITLAWTICNFFFEWAIRTLLEQNPYLTLTNDLSTEEKGVSFLWNYLLFEDGSITWLVIGVAIVMTYWYAKWKKLKVRKYVYINVEEE